MKIYVGHTREFDYKNGLYLPLRDSRLNDLHKIILPHENEDEPFDSRDYIQYECDLMIAEVSFPSTGLGIELGWADVYQIPIIFAYQAGSKVSGSLGVVSTDFVEYSTPDQLISGLERKITDLLQ